MSETTTTVKTISKWEFAGYWTALIGGFVLVVQGILMFFSYLAGGLLFIGGMSFFTAANLPWLNGLLSLLFGILVLFLIWKWLQIQIKSGPWIKDPMWLGIVLILIGLITGGSGGVLVLVGGVYYLLSIKN
ncbi:MAG: hypothetical protein FK732_12815 [Asgard group archaeon]|nr:hypothetical protein [Asgard group archaeon]